MKNLVGPICKHIGSVKSLLEIAVCLDASAQIARQPKKKFEHFTFCKPLIAAPSWEGCWRPSRGLPIIIYYNMVLFSIGLNKLRVPIGNFKIWVWLNTLEGTMVEPWPEKSKYSGRSSFLSYWTQAISWFFFFMRWLHLSTHGSNFWNISWTLSIANRLAWRGKGRSSFRLYNGSQV